MGSASWDHSKLKNALKDYQKNKVHFCLLSNMLDTTRQGWLQMDISPDSDLPHNEYDWARTVYTGVREELPYDLPKPLGKQVMSTLYVDANLHHDLITSKAVTTFYICSMQPQYIKREINHGNSNFWFRICGCKDYC